MAGPLLQPLLLLLLSFALGSAEEEAVSALCSVSASALLHASLSDTGERIINGVVCPRGSHPWQVALYDNNKLECSGVLVHQKWVLTVAHCHQRYGTGQPVPLHVSLWVLLFLSLSLPGEYIVQMGSDLRVDGRAQRIRATESFIHPRYDNRTDNHDIMLVKLSRPARLSPTVRTIDLPSGTKAPETSCTVSGWGVTTADGAETNPSQLMCSNVNLVSYQDCKKFYPTVLKKYMLCAAPPDGLSYCCKGDSGNPLICEGSLQGLVSSGYFPCTPPFEPVIYTRLCMYRKWVYKTIKANS
ncbi:PREDICTED: kallikrein-7-like [Myotis davidii]|uniref:kallikrein-7-like n=1 Tax=Myotis davidii TaxID=225400 RepID=UPI000767B7EF|nr:PREDICTED: kallikrein-7-like [Myotis davidii]